MLTFHLIPPWGSINAIVQGTGETPSGILCSVLVKQVQKGGIQTGTDAGSFQWADQGNRQPAL